MAKKTTFDDLISLYVRHRMYPMEESPPTSAERITTSTSNTMPTPTPTPTPVKISYRDLLNNQADIPGKIQSALGSKEGCLGIIVISDLPSEFIALREKLFHLAQRLATSSAEVKKTLEKPETHYFFGWSHGQEIMNGVGCSLAYEGIGWC
jgi:hypothetical protein